jgi:glycosyltransferase involved in cell wall biosynthesis
MRLSVAICTYNPDRALLRRVIDAADTQIAALGESELLLIDNNSSPSLREWEELAAYPLRLIRETTPGLTAARETAIREAVGEIIVFVDDDNVLGDGYLETVCHIFARNPSVGVVGGSIVPEYEVELPHIGDFEACLAVRRYAQGTWIETAAPPYSDFFPIGAGLAVRRELAAAYVIDSAAFGRIEGHQGNALTSGEDVDLDLFVLSQDRTLVIDGGLTLSHVIGRHRTEKAYLEPLVVGNIEGSVAHEKKWAPRFGQSEFPMFSLSLPGLVFKTAVAATTKRLSLHSYLRYRMFMTLTRLRLDALRGTAGHSPKSRPHAKSQEGEDGSEAAVVPEPGHSKRALR